MFNKKPVIANSSPTFPRNLASVEQALIQLELKHLESLLLVLLYLESLLEWWYQLLEYRLPQAANPKVLSQQTKYQKLPQAVKPEVLKQQLKYQE